MSMSECTQEDCARPQTEDSTLCRVHQLRTEVAGNVAPPKPAAKKRAPRKTTAKKATPKQADQ